MLSDLQKCKYEHQQFQIIKTDLATAQNERDIAKQYGQDKAKEAAKEREEKEVAQKKARRRGWNTAILIGGIVIENVILILGSVK